jgi:hypothetical protein
VTEAKKDIAHGINIHYHPSSFSLTPNLQADCQFIFYGEQDALLPPSALASTIGFADARSYHGRIAIAVILLPSSSFQLFLSLRSQTPAYMPLQTPLQPPPPTTARQQQQKRPTATAAKLKKKHMMCLISPCFYRDAETSQWHAKPWNINLILMDVIVGD